MTNNYLMQTTAWMGAF